ncbi:MAG: hypothetical protein COV44_11545 [Deltaproteobacteria bacterium CG11_big_fil_rev_8_21_14_0_20_45_16]|nr:MAG: hypothetical protein COV44_11545 [Deltaproteobacteria bacterium CG11_big_fil_rev_8_21_14_0_20_45_16]
MNYLSVWSLSSLDQAAMDASLISLCLQSKNYLESFLERTNAQIEAHQKLMSTTVKICQVEAHGLGMAAAASAGGLPLGVGAYERAYETRMRICNQIDIHGLEFRGQQLMFGQYRELLEFKSTEPKRWPKIFKINGLQLAWVHNENHKYSSLWLSAWSRQRSSLSQHILSQRRIARYGPNRDWPLTLEANSNLPNASLLKFSYQPQVKLLNDKLKSKSILSRPRSSAYLRSACQLRLKTRHQFFVQAVGR